MNTSGFFETLFKNARFNGILIMDVNGIILNMNEAFHLRFGYLIEDLVGQNFSLLFTEKDNATNKPKLELQSVLTEGSGNDENYLVHKDGSKIWVTGESILIENTKDEKYIVKIVHNIHAQKQLERFLLESHEFLDTVFDSIEESALLLLDSRLRIIKVNKAFLKMFDQKQPVAAGSRLSELDNAFWQRADVKQETINCLVMHNTTETNAFDFENASGVVEKVSFRAKLVESVPGAERKLLIMIKSLSTLM